MSDESSRRIYSGASPDSISREIGPLLDFTEEGRSLDEIEAELGQKLLPHLVRYDLPEFQSLYNFFPEEGALLGAEIALRFNQGVTNWMVSPGGAMLEELCCQALCRLFGLAEGSDATFMYCGTYANLQALYLALSQRAEKEGFALEEIGVRGFRCPEKLTVLASQEAHFSLRHAVRALGLGEKSLVRLPVDGNRRIDAGRLQEIVKDMRTEKDIFCIVATAGTTATGSIDSILPVTEAAREIDAWAHVDGAYGLAFYLLPERRHLFTGLEMADSIVWDPHKQFGVPIPNSLLFLRRGGEFRRMAIYGEYFNRRDDPDPNPGLKSPPSTRPLSALPLVTTIRHQGMKGIRERLRGPLAAIRSLAEKLDKEEDFEVCHQPDAGILCLRIKPVGFPDERLDELQQAIFEKTKEEARRSISIARLDKKTVLRFVAISPAVDLSALLETVQHVRSLAQEFIVGRERNRD